MTTGSRIRTPALALALLPGLCCGDEPGTAAVAPPERPAGTVLLVNDVPVTAEEIDAIGSDFALIEPQDSLDQLRRLAIATTVVPRIAVHDLDPARRDRARELAESYRTALQAGSLPEGPLTGPMEIERSGNFSGLGFALWREALRLAPGACSEVFETPGCFHVLRVKSREEASLPGQTRFTIGLFNFPFLDVETSRADTEAAIDRSRLTIVDETWRDAVPLALRYRLHAENP